MKLTKEEVVNKSHKHRSPYTYRVELYNEVLVSRPVDTENKLSLVGLLVLGLTHQVVPVHSQQSLREAWCICKDTLEHSMDK